ncbi:MAG: sulfotransferase family protein [Planctomycetota bacterium]|jgi:hypothetical protein
MAGEVAREGIIVLGCPRSGTTLVRRLLDSHPNISAPGETHLFTACARFLESDRTVDGMDVGVLSGLGYAGFDTDEVLRRLREFAFDFRREHAAGEGKGRWAEKTAVDAFHVDEIGRLCGEDAYFICVTRHGLDVACSMREWCERSEAYLTDVHEYVKRHARPLEAFCHAWVDVTTALRRFAAEHPDNTVAVRYEDLVADPDAEMRRLIEFVGEPWDPELVARALRREDAKGFSDWKTFSKTEIDHSSIGRWEGLSSGTIADLAAIVNPTLRECGYDEIEIEGGGSEEEARRRYELGLLLRRMKSGDDEPDAADSD